MRNESLGESAKALFHRHIAPTKSASPLEGACTPWSRRHHRPHRMVKLVETSGDRADVCSGQEGTWHGQVIACRRHVAGSFGDGYQWVA